MGEDYIYGLLDRLSYNYKWEMDYVYNLDFYDVLILNKRIASREESNAKAKLRRLQMLTVAIHTSEPNEFIEELDRSIEGEESFDEIGDLEGLEKLKIKRQGYKVR